MQLQSGSVWVCCLQPQLHSQTCPQAHFLGAFLSRSSSHNNQVQTQGDVSAVSSPTELEPSNEATLNPSRRLPASGAALGSVESSPQTGLAGTEEVILPL